ncbi:hypothetical protein E4U15_006458, partial [Claviceps sp. LM218 group G6]
MPYQTEEMDIDFDDMHDEHTDLQSSDEDEVLEEPPSLDAASKYAYELLNSPDDIFKDVLRLTKNQFYRLLQWLKANTRLDKERQLRTCEQKLMVFLYIMGFGETQRNTAHRF